jgi:hypothetical protein
MAKRSSNSNKTELIKTITPIGQEVPKGGIPIDSKPIENMDLAGSQRAVTGKKIRYSIRSIRKVDLNLKLVQNRLTKK